MTSQDSVHARLEDRIFTLELALSGIGGALLAPGGWEDDQRLHQYMYDSVRRALLHTPFGEALDQREQQLFVREAAPIVNEPAHQTEAVPAPAVAPDEPAVTLAPDPAPVAVEDPAPADEAGLDGPREYGWPTRP